MEQLNHIDKMGQYDDIPDMLMIESFAHIECYSDCSRRGSLWWNPFVTVLSNVLPGCVFCYVW